MLRSTTTQLLKKVESFSVHFYDKTLA